MPFKTRKMAFFLSEGRETLFFAIFVLGLKSETYKTAFCEKAEIMVRKMVLFDKIWRVLAAVEACLENTRGVLCWQTRRASSKDMPCQEGLGATMLMA